MNILQQLEAEQVAKLVAVRAVPPFQPGDTVRVSLRVVEGDRERIQAFEGVCIARKNAGLNSAFTVRKISHGTGVERVFQSHSPAIDSVVVKRHGKVRGAKLYYLRGLEGKKARIKEDLGASASAASAGSLANMATAAKRIVSALWAIHTKP